LKLDAPTCRGNWCRGYTFHRIFEIVRSVDTYQASLLFVERRIDSDQVSKAIQKGASEGKRVLERLLERGLIEARGEKRARIYHLAAALYNRLEDVSGYVRTKGFDKIQQHQMVLSALAARKDKRITREDVAELCKITPAQAYHLLKKMSKDNELELHGSGRGSCYRLKTHR
jgi:ATP-dependent DNA helicase RecG